MFYSSDWLCEVQTQIGYLCISGTKQNICCFMEYDHQILKMSSIKTKPKMTKAFMYVSFHKLNSGQGASLVYLSLFYARFQ